MTPPGPCPGPTQRARGAHEGRTPTLYGIHHQPAASGQETPGTTPGENHSPGAPRSAPQSTARQRAGDVRHDHSNLRKDSGPDPERTRQAADFAHSHRLSQGTPAGPPYPVRKPDPGGSSRSLPPRRRDHHQAPRPLPGLRKGEGGLRQLAAGPGPLALRDHAQGAGRRPGPPGGLGPPGSDPPNRGAQCAPQGTAPPTAPCAADRQRRRQRGGQGPDHRTAEPEPHRVRQHPPAPRRTTGGPGPELHVRRLPR